MQKELEITTFDETEREYDSEIAILEDSEYYPSSCDESELNFKVGSIYMISSTGTDKVYIGSTINPAQRWSAHKSEYKKGVSRCTSRFILEYGNYTFTILSQIKYTTEEALRDIERQIMKQYTERLVNKHYNCNDSNKAASTYTCNYCNKELNKRCKSLHNKSKKHIANIEAEENKKELLTQLSKG